MLKSSVKRIHYIYMIKNLDLLTGMCLYKVQCYNLNESSLCVCFGQMHFCIFSRMLIVCVRFYVCISCSLRQCLVHVPAFIMSVSAVSETAVG